MQLVVDEAAEWAIPYAKRELDDLIAWLDMMGLPSGMRRVDYADGVWGYVQHTEFRDTIYLEGVDGYWEEGYPEQDLWSESTSVSPQEVYDPLPIQQIQYNYLTGDMSGEEGSFSAHETRHQWVICRYCQRVAEFELSETWDYGTNLVLEDAMKVEYVYPVLTVIASSTPQLQLDLAMAEADTAAHPEDPDPWLAVEAMIQAVLDASLEADANATRYRVIGEWVPGSGEEDPGVPGRLVPLMIMNTTTEYETSTSIWDELPAPIGELVSRDEGTGAVVATVTSPITSPIVIEKNIVHMAEFQSVDDTNVTVWDWVDDGRRITREVPHGLRAAEEANTHGRFGITVTLTPMVPGRISKYGSPGPVLYSGISWTHPDGPKTATTPVFFNANPGWGRISGGLSIFSSDATTDYYQGGSTDFDYDPYSTPELIADQVELSREIWDYVQKTMDEKRFCPTAELSELKPHTTKLFDSLLVFPVRRKATLTIEDGAGVEHGTYLWNSSYPYSNITAFATLVPPASAGPIPAWEYTMGQPCLFTWGKKDLTDAEKESLAAGTLPLSAQYEFKLDSAPPTYEKFYFSFGTAEMKGYNQRSYFGLYRVEGEEPTTGLYEYSQLINDQQMYNACLGEESLAYAAYSALYAPLRGAYWRKTPYVWNAAIYQALVEKDQAGEDADAKAATRAEKQAAYEALRDATDPPTATEVLAEAQAQLDTSIAEHEAAIATLAARQTTLDNVIASAVADPYKVTQPAIPNVDNDPLTPV